MLFLVTGRMAGLADPSPEFLRASKETLELLATMEANGTVKGGGVMIGPLGVCFVADVASNDDLHLLLTTMPEFRFATWDAMPLIPLHRDIEMSLDDALARAQAAPET